MLERRILKDGAVKTGDVLRVDSFLNHRLDVDLLNELGREFKRRFAGERITVILTAEASGIALAAITAQYFKVPVVFAKKSRSSNLENDVYSARVVSFTRGGEYDFILSKKYLTPKDRVLIIDDFLANGCAAEGLLELTEKAGARISGIGVAIEKGFQKGGARLRGRGVRLESLAVVESMDAESGKIVFRKQ